MPIIISGISLKFTQPPEIALEQAKRLVAAPVTSASIYKRAVDARRKNDIRFVYSVALDVGDNEAKIAEKIPSAKLIANNIDALQMPNYKLKTGTNPPIVVGFGPAGMFAALYLARLGASPIVLERGAPIEQRVLDVDAFFAGGKLNPESNIQFGEGGAGTFSDGKLTTRTHDSRCDFVLRELVRHGAPKEILVQAKPHVGTDLLRDIVKSIRNEIISLGGKIHFNTKLDGIVTADGRIVAAKTSRGEIAADSIILAVGHSARDTFESLNKIGVGFESKAFSVGVRIEHLQADVDKALYGDFAAHPLLPKAEYQHSLRRDNRAVYTFCMCPGGVVVPAASELEGVVTNGMSAFSRDQENANSALVVSVDAADFGGNPFDGVNFQRRLEQAAFVQGGKSYRAPAQDVGSFLASKAGLKLGKIKPSYLPSVADGDFAKLFPKEITEFLQMGLRAFGQRQSGFADISSILTGVETRTSSPVRITRGENLQALGIEGLYPCGEGAGYAGGIMSAAVDGLRCAEAVAKTANE